MIRLEGVNKRFGDHHALKDVSLSVAKGEVLCVVGPSGSGKSTMLRCINHLETVDSGTIYFDEAPVYQGLSNGRRHADSDREVEAIRAKVGMVFQSFNLFSHLSVIENITVAPVHVLGRSLSDATQAAYALLDKVGLRAKANDYPHELSGGQQQRVAIARALAMQPEVMLFDEVTSFRIPLYGILAVVGILVGVEIPLLLRICPKRRKVCRLKATFPLRSFDSCWIILSLLTCSC